MAYPTKPVSRPSWTDPDATLRTIPTASKMAVGFSANERPTRQLMNWLFYNIGTEWLTYFEQATDAIKGLTGIYDAYVGTVSPLANYSSLAAAVAAVPVGGRILVLEDQNLASTVQILTNNIEIQVKPGANILKSGTVAGSTGIRVSATGVRIRGGRLSGFTGAGDIGILVDATSAYCMLGEMRFGSNTTDFVDNSGSLTTYALIQE